MALLLIRNGRVINPSSGLDDERDILVENGKIREITKNIASIPSAETINAKGKIVLPGLIDMHVHLRDPGREDEETIFTGTRAAAKGGFTSVACMANTDPVADNSAVIEYMISKTMQSGAVNVFPVGAITKGLKGEEIAEMGQMIEAGAVAFSDDGRCVTDSNVMRHALEYARQFGRTVISHSEDHQLSDGGYMNESYLSTIWGLKGIPPIAEEIMVERDILLASEFGHVHIAHVSTAGSVEKIRRAKAKGINITCETAPHYFTLTEAAVEGYNTNAKMNPPLRSESDVAAVIEGLKDGTIDAIATDHAPHTVEEKNVEFASAAFGIIGLETALGLVMTELVETKVLSLIDAVTKMTVNPAKILGIDKGSLKIGGDADLTIIDLGEWTVDPGKFASKSRNTPFAGWKLKGRALYTIVRGKIVVKDGVLVK
ncbi:MAG: dihydroorotase [Candidatus Saganbacteria bacterium]|nr:dihydroorotase [Candidatus Saganbacteria bacterium]